MTGSALRRYFDIQDAAAYLDLHPKTVRKLIATGQLPAKRIGKSIRIKVDDLDAVGKPIPSARSAA